MLVKSTAMRGVAQRPRLDACAAWTPASPSRCPTPRPPARAQSAYFKLRSTNNASGRFFAGARLALGNWKMASCAWACSWGAVGFCRSPGGSCLGGWGGGSLWGVLFMYNRHTMKFASYLHIGPTANAASVAPVSKEEEEANKQRWQESGQGQGSSDEWRWTLNWDSMPRHPVIIGSCPRSPGDIVRVDWVVVVQGCEQWSLEKGEGVGGRTGVFQDSFTVSRRSPLAPLTNTHSPSRLT